jgi:N-dimethylarginine dimethylaminohydrolase
MTVATTARFLMCRPDHFGVTYSINPWMNPEKWARNVRALSSSSRGEWTALQETLLSLGAAIEFVPPVKELPDLVFTANAAVVFDRTALLARFRHPERQREQRYFEAAFHAPNLRGLIDRVTKLPDDLVLEGAGDCAWDQTRKLFWMGYGPRSDAASASVVEDVFRRKVIALELVDARFYHIDTALCSLPRGEIMYVPDAFTAEGRAAINERVEPAQQIEVRPDDARRLAANAVCISNVLIMSACSERLRSQLKERGYRVVTTPLRSFLRSGGSALCLALRLDFRSQSTALGPDNTAMMKNSLRKNFKPETELTKIFHQD